MKVALALGGAYYRHARPEASRSLTMTVDVPVGLAAAVALARGRAVPLTAALEVEGMTARTPARGALERRRRELDLTLVFSAADGDLARLELRLDLGRLTLRALTELTGTLQDGPEAYGVRLRFDARRALGL